MYFNISIKQMAVNKINSHKSSIMRLCRHCVCSANTNCWCKTGNLCKVNTGLGLNNQILFIFTVNIILEAFLKMSLFEYKKAKKEGS